MAEENINFDEIYFETLTSLNVPEHFDCEDDDLNGFLLDDALSYANDGVATTTLVVYKDIAIAFFALCSDSIRLTWSEKRADTKIFYPEYPALKIARLAIASKYKGRGIGHFLLDVILGLAQAVTKEQNIAIKYLSVDAYSNSKSFYEKYGFKINQAKDENPISVYEKEPVTVSMRYLVENRVEEDS